MNKKVIGYLFSIIKPHIALMIVSIISALMYVVSSLLIPVFVGKSIDLMLGYNNVNFSQIYFYLILICLLLIFASVFQYIMSYVNNKLSNKVINIIRDNCFKKIQSLPIRYLDNNPPGEIVSRIINDSEVVSDGLLLGFNQLFTGVMLILLTLIFMFVMNFIMALVVVILTPLSLFVAKFVASNIHKYFNSQAVIKAQQTSFINENIHGQKVIKAFNKTKDKQEEFEVISQELETVALKANFFSSLVNPTTRFVNAIVYSLICLIGAFVVMNNSDFTAGMLTIFLTYASQYTKPFNDISSVLTELQNSLTCGSRIYDLLHQQEDLKDNLDIEELNKIQGEVTIKDVTFAYEENQKLIENFNIQIKPGQKVAIVGPTGCGKTTLINLLMRFYDVNKGDILIDQKSIYNLRRNDVRENYGMVLQETYIRHASIKDNILMGLELTDEELMEVLKNSHLDHFVSLLTEGVNTIISDNDGLLSQGQKQLLCIARVMANIPPMLILDEATSSIDTRTEIKIQDAFNKMMINRTSFIVAHRLSTIKNADMIIVMNQGHIIEQGNHAELIDKKGFYYNLYNSQFVK